MHNDGVVLPTHPKWFKPKEGCLIPNLMQTPEKREADFAVSQADLSQMLQS